MLPKDIDSIDGLECADVPTDAEKQLLRNLVYKSLLDKEDREIILLEIQSCLSYGLYVQLQHRLEDLQTPPDRCLYPSYKQIWNHIKKITR